MVISTNAYYNM